MTGEGHGQLTTVIDSANPGPVTLSTRGANFVAVYFAGTADQDTCDITVTAPDGNAYQQVSLVAETGQLNKTTEFRLADFEDTITISANAGTVKVRFASIPFSLVL